jgi:hypothetical protein
VALKGREESVAIYAVDRISERSGSP